MSQYLYRGISVLDDDKNKGKLLPKGKSSLAIPGAGEQGVQCGEGYVAGYSEGNGVRAHRVDSDMKKLCYISTSRDIEIAKRFATSNNIEDGYLYILDARKFERYGVLIPKVGLPHDAHEQEVTIRSKDNGELPAGIIVEKVLIRCT